MCVCVCVAEKQLHFDQVNVDILTGENLDPKYMKINPTGQVPTLVVNGTVSRHTHTHTNTHTHTHMHACCHCIAHGLMCAYACASVCVCVCVSMQPITESLRICEYLDTIDNKPLGGNTVDRAFIADFAKVRRPACSV